MNKKKKEHKKNKLKPIKTMDLFGLLEIRRNFWGPKIVLQNSDRLFYLYGAINDVPPK